VAYVNNPKRLYRGEHRVGLVGARGNIEELIDLLGRVKLHVDQDTKINILSDSPHVLDNLLDGDTAFFGPGCFQISGLGNLMFGGVIRGMYLSFL